MRILGSLTAMLGLALGLLAFQNCTQADFTTTPAPVASLSTDPSTPTPVVDPTNPGVTAIFPPFPACKGSPNTSLFNDTTGNFTFSLPDASVIIAEGDLFATATSSFGVFSQRFDLSSGANRLFSPGSSYSPQNPVTGARAAAIAFAPANNYVLTISPQGVQSVTSQQIFGQVYPLCGSSKVLWYRTKADPGSPTSGTPFSFDVNVPSNAVLVIAAEKTDMAVPTHLEIGVKVLNLTTNQVYSCPFQGGAIWNYNSTSTPSVSGHCSINVPSGDYRITNVITTDAPNGNNASQHLGILAIGQ